DAAGCAARERLCETARRGDGRGESAPSGAAPRSPGQRCGSVAGHVAADRVEIARGRGKGTAALGFPPSLRAAARPRDSGLRMWKPFRPGPRSVSSDPVLGISSARSWKVLRGLPMKVSKKHRGLRALAGGALLLAAACCAFRAAERRAAADEPRYFAIRNVKVVPVSGPPVEGSTVVIAKGLIAAVGKDVPIPPEAWVIDGKGLTVYPGLIDALTDVGLGAAETPGQAAGAGAGRGRPAGPITPEMISRGPQDRPGSTPWVDAADELNVGDKKIETWRSGGFTTALTAPKAGLFPGQGALIDLAGERPRDLVVKPSATVQLTLNGPGGFFGFPGSLMGSISYIRQVFLD